MKVIKVLNNSVLLAQDDAGEERILMGKGIGFGRAAGSELTEAEIDKIFVLQDKTVQSNVIQLAQEVDSLYFELAKTAIDKAQSEYGMKLMDHLYLSLTDHLAFAVHRAQEGRIIENFYTNDMKEYNPNEVAMGRYCIELVKEKIGVELPEDEVGYIAFHFINAQENNPYSEKNKKIRELSGDILLLIQLEMKVEYKEDSISYSRLLTHLRLFIKRLIENKQVKDKEQDFLYETVRYSCPMEYACTQKIKAFVQKETGKNVTRAEELYLMLHIHRVREEE